MSRRRMMMQFNQQHEVPIEEASGDLFLADAARSPLTVVGRQGKVVVALASPRNREPAARSIVSRRRKLLLLLLLL